MSFRGHAGQQGSFQGYMPREGPGGLGDRHDSGYFLRNANSSSPGDSRPSGSGHNYSRPRALLRTPSPPFHLCSHSNAAQPQVPTGTLPYQITVSVNAPPAESLSHPNPVPIPPSRPFQSQPAGAMPYPDPPPPYTPYPEYSPLSRLSYQAAPDELRGRGSKEGLPEKGKGNRMQGNFSQSVRSLEMKTSHQFDEVKREQPEPANSNSNYYGPRKGQSYNGRRGCFPSGRGNRGTSVSRDEKDVLGSSSVGHDGGEFSDRPSSDENHRLDGAFPNRGRGDNRQFSNQRGRGQRRGQSGGVRVNRGGCNNKGGRRKSAAKTSVSQDNRGNSMDSMNEHEAVQRLLVQLHFATSFETASIMKKHIQSALNDLEGVSLELLYEEILLEHKLDKSFCKFTISDCNISSAQNCVEKMVCILKKKLQISIDANFKLLSNGKVQGSHESGSDMPKKASSGDFKRDAAISAQETVSQRKKERSRSKPASKGQENKNTAPISIPTTLHFSVEKCFSLPSGFKTFLRNAASTLRFDYEIDDGSIALTAKISECQIQTKSKADARRFVQHFTEFQKQTQLCITCNIVDKHTHDQEVNNLLDKTKSTMLKIKSEFLQKHEKRISQNKEEFKKISSALLDPEAEINFKAIHDKLSEAIKQRGVFVTCFDKLFSKLELPDFSASQKDAINQVEHLFNMECSRFSRALPIYAHKDSIIHQVESNQVSIIVGENGCGKSTQIAQYLFDAGFSSTGKIVCTQPSQLTALSLADKVSKEKAVKVGSLVGYKTGMAAKVSSSTKILYATDLSLLNEFQEDPDMEKYSCIIVDEAHEHSVYTDLLLGMIKSCLPKRPDLKIIIISAPGHQEVFLRYFKIHQELKVSGSNFTVDTIFTEDSSEGFEDYEDKAICQALKVHAKEGEGDILIFVSLPIETLRCCQEFESRFMGEKKNFLCLPLHSKLPPQELKKVFDTPLNLNGQRKIIFTTKFAETSISIDSVKYIIDTGVTSETKYDHEQKVNLTTTCPVSQVSAMQRRRCAGHSQGGKCYHLYSKKVFNQLTKTQFPEILRVHLEKAVLKLFELKVDLKCYEFVQAPSKMALDLTIDTLTRYGAIDYSSQITKAGKLISAMPFDPKLGSFITEAPNIGLLYEAIVLAAIVSLGSDLSYRSVSETEAEVDARNKRFLGFEKMDSFAWLHVYKLWSEMPNGERAQWCRSKSINYKLISSVRQCIEEVHGLMTKYFNIEFSYSFSEKTDAMVLLKELYIKCKQTIF